jgi:glucosyl-3-phosphoglycerate synthase
MAQFSSILRQFQAHSDKYEQVEYEIVEEERPPMITLPEYREKFGKK